MRAHAQVDSDTRGSSSAGVSETQTSSTTDVYRGGRQLGGLDGQRVVEMSVGATHAAFVLAGSGEVRCIGSNVHGECGVDPLTTPAATGLRRVPLPRLVGPAVQAACGRSHTLVLTAEGMPLSWGDDSRIQLGLGDTRSNFRDERPWSGSQGYIRYLQTGEQMAPTSAGRDLQRASGGSGFNTSRLQRSGSRSMYGEYEPHHQWQPQILQEIPLEHERQAHGIPYPPPDAVRCGDDFSVLMVRDSPDWFEGDMESNRLFCCGENGRGQCGRSLQASQQTFAAVRTPKNSKTETLSCGAAHCLAVVRIKQKNNKRELWAWGSNAEGQAGGGKVAVICPAAKIRLPVKGVRIEAAWCDFASSAVICAAPPIP